jgi:HlyD family secretion protein
MKRFAIAAVVLVAQVGVGWLVVQRIGAEQAQGTLYGNVEIRQVDLAFDSEGTATAVLKREGGAVKPGEVIATLGDAAYRCAT